MGRINLMLKVPVGRNSKETREDKEKQEEEEDAKQRTRQRGEGEAQSESLPSDMTRRTRRPSLEEGHRVQRIKTTANYWLPAVIISFTTGPLTTNKARA